MNAPPAPSGWRPATWALLLGCAVLLYAALRLRWAGHLLMWDEAMNLLSVRAFVAGGRDDYASWFWRYPPLYNLLLAVVSPLSPGYVTRAEWMTLAVQLSGVIVLASLNRRTFGPRVGLLSVFALALMPGSVFFGLWIKQDHLAATAGLVALWLCSKQRWALAGFALGAALLAKQFAAFFAIAIAVELARQRLWRPLVIVAVISALASLWWYALFGTSSQQLLRYAATGVATDYDVWARPWHFYGPVLWNDIGPAGLALAIAGLVLLLRQRDGSWWPAALLVPALLVFSASPGKTPWYLMTFYPAAATLQAIAGDRMWTWLQTRMPDRALLAAIGLATLAAGAVVAPVFRGTYEDHMKRREPGMWDASFTSREAAEALNARVKPGEKALVSSMHYYGPTVRAACPIFVTYLKDMPVLVRPYQELDASNVVATVRTHGLDWALLSPPPGAPADALIRQMHREHGLKPELFRGALLYHTSSLKPAASPAPPAH